MKNLITATWAMTIDEDVLVREMLASGEYGIGGYPISEESMTEFFRNWAFGLDPNTYREEWARNSLCHYQMSIFDTETERDLWQATYTTTEENN